MAKQTRFTLDRLPAPTESKQSRSDFPYSRLLAAARPFAYLVVIAWLNIYICRESFYTEATGHFNSMHGIWMALARLGRFTSWKPVWFPWWGAGVPLEYTYAPLVPALTALISKLTHVSIAMAFNQLSGAVYCATPVLLYLVSWRLSGLAGYSFAAAVGCSLLTPITLIAPDFSFRIASIRDARRFFLVFDWDDLPHLTAITLFPVLVWSLARAIGTRRRRYYAIAIAAMSSMMLANMFGVVLAALALVTVPWTYGARARMRNFLTAAFVGICAYLLVCPWLPPSLLATIRSNSALDGEAAKTGVTLISLAVVAIAAVSVRYIVSRFTADWKFRWLAVTGLILILIPLLDVWKSLHFLPQPGRYKDEADIAIVWIAVFGLRALIGNWPAFVRAAMVSVLIFFAVEQTIQYRRYAKFLLRPADVPHSIEFETAKWVEGHFPRDRVMLTGSISQWANAFTNDTQLAAQPYTTTPNFNQFVAYYVLRSGENAGSRDALASVLWLKAFGAEAVVVPGPQSPEYWKPFVNPRKFEGVLPLLWRDRDTSIYGVSSIPYSLAHVVPRAGLVQHAPVHGLDTGEIARYVAAIEKPGAPMAHFEWQGTDAAVIDAHLMPDEIVSAQINYHAGWHARANGREAKLRRDGIGLMAIEPDCTGNCHIVLQYDGGPELRACRYVSTGSLLLLLVLAFSRYAGARRA